MFTFLLIHVFQSVDPRVDTSVLRLMRQAKLKGKPREAKDSELSRMDSATSCL
jgi:hypothetical protein